MKKTKTTTISIPFNEQTTLLDDLQHAEQYSAFMELIHKLRENTFLETTRYFANKVGGDGQLTHCSQDYYIQVLHTFHNLEVSVDHHFPAKVVLRNFLDRYEKEEWAMDL